MQFIIRFYPERVISYRVDNIYIINAPSLLDILILQTNHSIKFLPSTDRYDITSGAKLKIMDVSKLRGVRKAVAVSGM